MCTYLGKLFYLKFEIFKCIVRTLLNYQCVKLNTRGQILMYNGVLTKSLFTRGRYFGVKRIRMAVGNP